MPATYSSFLYCGPISNKAGPPPPRRGRDGEGGAEGWGEMGKLGRALEGKRRRRGLEWQSRLMPRIGLGGGGKGGTTLGGSIVL